MTRENLNSKAKLSKKVFTVKIRQTKFNNHKISHFEKALNIKEILSVIHQRILQNKRMKPKQKKESTIKAKHN